MATANTVSNIQIAEIAARRKSRRKIIERVWLVILQILLTLFLITFLVPALWMVSSSLKASTEVFAHPIVWIPESPQWNNYVRVFEILPFGTFAWNTLLVVVFAVLGTLFSSVLVGYSFARLRWPGRDIFFGLLIATLMLPEVITLVPRFIIFRELGWIDTLLPLTVPYWFGATPWTPLYIFLMRQFFKGIPLELEEAAFIDGASRFRTLVQIMLPLSKPVLATVAVFATLQHYTDFMNPLIYISSIDNWTLALGIAGLNANESYKASWELVFAAGTFMTLPMIVLFIFAQRYFVQGITMSGFGGR
ncbi:MAG: carbohydrate ABC transporter permease [Chloroflexi bacterium]|nr:MAG: carbohydrate ABC transporter permease [Chloroflexota bacterium]